jgi:ferritin-like metal-binding protein YciE
VLTGTQVEHYEIALYGTMRALASILGLAEAAELLGQTLTEEKAANTKLTEIATKGVNHRAVGIQNRPKGIVVI